MAIACVLVVVVSGKPITGPELATLLEVLVTAANEGSLAEVFMMYEISFPPTFIDTIALYVCIDIFAHFQTYIICNLDSRSLGSVY